MDGRDRGITPRRAARVVRATARLACAAMLILAVPIVLLGLAISFVVMLAVTVVASIVVAPIAGLVNLRRQWSW